MAEIALRSKTLNVAAIVDQEDFARFGSVNWFAMIKPNGKIYAYRGRHPDGAYGAVLLHRLILDAQKGQQVDHINGNGLDNRRENLRFCTPRQNAQNRHRRRDAKSPYKGVQPDGKKFSAQIIVDGQVIRIGKFATAVDAAHAYDKAAIERFGSFARVNFIGERLA